MSDANWVCYHEAGHAVGEVALGFDFWDVQVSDDRQTGKTQPRPSALVAGKYKPRDHVIILWAGLIAQAKYTGEDLEAVFMANYAMMPKDGDVAKIEFFRVKGKMNQRTLDRCFMESVKLVNKHWDWIARVANSLARHGRLTGDQVRRLRRVRLSDPDDADEPGEGTADVQATLDALLPPKSSAG